MQEVIAGLNCVGEDESCRICCKTIVDGKAQHTPQIDAAGLLSAGAQD
jgi:hypothetical protein